MQEEVVTEVARFMKATADHKKILDELKLNHSTEVADVKKQWEDDLSRKTLEFDKEIADANTSNAELKERLRNEKAQSEKKLDIAGTKAKQLECSAAVVT